MSDINLNCPFCGGVLSPPLGSRRVNCSFCGEKLYFKSPEFIPRFVLEARENNLREKSEQLFKNKIINPSVKKEAVVVSKRVRFIPFYLMSGKKGGVSEPGKERIVYKNPSKIDLGSDDGSTFGKQYQKLKTETIIEEDSRVVLGDFRYIYNSVSIEDADLGLDELRKTINENLEKIKPVNLEEIAKAGEVITPSITKENIVERGVLSAKGGKEEIEILELQMAIVYYPVLEVTFKFRESYFSITYDLFEDRFLWGMIPCNRKPLVILSLILSSFLGFFFGQFLKFVFIPITFKTVQENLGFFVYFGTILFLILSLIFGGGLNIAFLLLKTPFGAKVKPDGLFLSRWGEPPKSFLSPFLRFVLKVLKEGFENSLKGRKSL